MTIDDFRNGVLEDKGRIAGEMLSLNREDRIALAAQRLAVDFAEDTELPARYRKSPTASDKARKVKEDSVIEKRFKSNVEAWKQLIETMLTKINEGQAWRFINLSPQVDNAMKKVTDSRDFCDFADYLALRRDQESCGPEELGGLAMLSTAFQRAVEKRLQTGWSEDAGGC